jgi:hypothetical protein
MANIDELTKLCYDEKGGIRPKPECRAVLINHLILEESLDIDEAEDLAEKTLQQVDLWPVEELPPAPTATI